MINIISIFENSIDKVNQINELANKMFEYFLVFSKDQDTELSKMSPA